MRSARLVSCKLFEYRKEPKQFVLCRCIPESCIHVPDYPRLYALVSLRRPSAYLSCLLGELPCCVYHWATPYFGTQRGPNPAPNATVWCGPNSLASAKLIHWDQDPWKVQQSGVTWESHSCKNYSSSGSIRKKYYRRTFGGLGHNPWKVKAERCSRCGSTDAMGYPLD